MTVPIASTPNHRANLIGSLWMMAAMVAFSFEDAFVKAVSETHAVGQVLLVFGVGGTLLFAVIARFQNSAYLIQMCCHVPWASGLFLKLLGGCFTFLHWL